MITGVNYCSMWFAGSWNHCCYAHDNSALDLASHIELASCVAATGNAPIGVLMGMAVVTFGPGYGWLKRRGWVR